MHVDLVREALLKQPFQPFTLRLVDGRALPVPHREFVAVSNRRVVVIDPQDEGMSVVEPLLILSIEYTGMAGADAGRERDLTDGRESWRRCERPAITSAMALPGVDWKGYLAIGRVLADRPGLRLTYDRGVLEIMTISSEHDRIKHLLRRLLEAWTEERDMTLAGYGSMTFKRRKLLRGLEPDECFWIANEPKIRGRDDIDLRVDPPPDLVLEIDVSRSSLNRMSIYGAMGVPEVWRYTKGTLVFRVRQSDGRYADAPASLAVPPLTPADLTPFLAMRGATEENALVRQFRAWIRQRLPAGGTAPPAP